MEPILFNAISGGSSNFQKQGITANNLANINTIGFKKDLFVAQIAKFDQNGQKLSNSAVPKVIVDTTPGEIITTGRNLDVAIDGDGWFAVKDSQGNEAYTRNGSLRIGVNGQLINSSGRQVMGDGGPISIPPAKSIDIANDGTISIIPLEGDLKSVAVLDRIKLVKLQNANIYKNEEGLIQLSKGQAKPDSSIKVVSGALEGSNVNAIEQMVQMIDAGRKFESHMKILTTVADNGSRLAQLLRD